MAAINPYLTFNGNCEEVFEFYRGAFGGEFRGGVMRFGEMPGCEEGDKDKVMHVALPIGGGSVLMGSDTPPSMAVTAGNNISVAIAADSIEESDKLFAALSEGGTVVMPMADAPWGAYFGMFADKFGINWMINCDTK